jgi:lipid-A-disaccharide synthase
MLVAAEASGDALGGGLGRALQRRLGPDVEFVGVGGDHMAALGVKSPFDIAEISVLGLLEGLRAIPRVKRRANDTVALAVREKPDIAVLIDSWGYTTLVAQALRKQMPGLPLVKYVAPQVWAMRQGRTKVVAETFDHLLTIHVFDAPYFEAVGVPVTYVGNASLHVDFSKADPARLRARLGIGEGEPVLLVLPGSRLSEIARMMPPFEDTVNILKARYPDLHVVVPAAPTVAELVKTKVAGWPHRAHVVEGEEAKLDAMKAATLALACSGTVTTELAAAGCPLVLGYRLNQLSYEILKRVIRNKQLALLNIAVRDWVIPEYVQGACTGEAMAAKLSEWLDDPAARAAQVAAQNLALETMGRSGADPAELAADAVLRVVAEKGVRPTI